MVRAFVPRVAADCQDLVGAIICVCAPSWSSTSRATHLVCTALLLEFIRVVMRGPSARIIVPIIGGTGKREPAFNEAAT